MSDQQEIKLSRLHITSIVDAIGRHSIEALLYIFRLMGFIISALLSIRKRGHGIRGQKRPLASQIIFSGVDSLPAITIISLAIALTVTAQFILLLQSLTSEKEVVRLLTQLVAQELAPLITAIILIGRSGSAITVDLGNMRIHKEIRGLELLGINIMDFFVFPRIAGMALSQVALAVYFTAIVMGAGVIFAALLDSPSHYKYLFILGSAFSPADLLYFLLKNLLFGTFIGAIACYHGLRVELSVTEMPQQTQQAIVNSMVFVFVLDGLMVALR